MRQYPRFSVLPYRLAPFLFSHKNGCHYGVDDHREEDRRRGDVLIVQLGEVVVQEVLEHIDCLVRVVSVEKIALAEDLQGVHHREDEREEQSRRDVRDRDPDRLLKRVRPVDPRGLDHALVHPGQGGEHQHHVQSAVLPEEDEQQGVKRREGRNVSIPQHDDGRGGQDHRQEQGGLDERKPCRKPDEQEGEDQGNRHRQRNGEDGELPHVLHRQLEVFVLEQPLEVVEPDELLREGVFREGVIERIDEGDDEEGEEAREGGEQ